MSSEDPAICDDVEIVRRVEQIRKRREEEAEAEKNRLRDLRLTWEAEAVIAFENVNVMNEITDDTDLYRYISNKGVSMRNIDSKIIHSICNGSLHYQFPFDKEGFKIKYLVNKIKTTKESSEYKEREALRKKLIEDERIRKEKALEEEERILKEKAFQEEQVRRQGVIDETNANIKKSINNRENTFTELQLSDWDKPRQREFLLKENNEAWAHYSARVANKSFNLPHLGPCNEWTNPLFLKYYEEGKVPFCTKCPVCKSPTKLNYIIRGGGAGTQGQWKEKSCSFKEVYCENHYMYNSRTNKHYTTNKNGFPIRIVWESQEPRHVGWVPPVEDGIKITLPYQNWGGFESVDWKPNDNNWKEWDPLDPDGSKVEAEKKKKEVENIQKQIAELQAKLVGLS